MFTCALHVLKLCKRIYLTVAVCQETSTGDQNPTGSTHHALGPVEVVVSGVIVREPLYRLFRRRFLMKLRPIPLHGRRGVHGGIRR